MNFDITNTDWAEIENLTDDTTYMLQAKTVSDSWYYKNYATTNILLTQADTLPTDNKTGILASDIKFKKVSGLNIYIKAINVPTNIDIQEVQ